MSYPLYSAPKVPDRSYEKAAISVALLFSALTEVVVWSAVSAGWLFTDVIKVGLFAIAPVGIPVIAYFFLRYRRLKAEVRKDCFHQRLREGFSS